MGYVRSSACRRLWTVHRYWVVSLLLLFAHVCPMVFAYEELSDDALRHISGGGADFNISSGPLLAPLLTPRVPGTPGSTAAQSHFIDFFSAHLPKWELSWHNSTSKTPLTGPDTDIPFRNLIFWRDPPWARPGDVGRLTLVAHYDSLYIPEGFIGATDSATPCAMLMHVARSIDAALTKKWDAMEESGEAGSGLEEDEKGVQIIFLDGEEAWVSWSETDSLYGARALAEHWESDFHPVSSVYRSQLDSISLFVLLDLLGGADPHVPSYFPNTHWAYQGMARIEARMRKLDLLSSKPRNNQVFLPESGKRPNQFTVAYVQDDHVPFMVRGVDILHIIPTPFPPVWHTMEDDGEHLDPATVDDWAKIITAFTAEWLELDDLTGAPRETDASKAERGGHRDAAYREKSEL